MDNRKTGESESEEGENRKYNGNLILETQRDRFGLYSEKESMEYSNGVNDAPSHTTTVVFTSVDSVDELGGNVWGNRKYTFVLRHNTSETAEDDETERVAISEIEFPSSRPSPGSISVATKLLEQYAEVKHFEYTNPIWEDW